jgi:CRP-like cAMP-binding protein
MSTAIHVSPEHGRLVTKLESISRLDASERAAIAALPLRTRTVEAGTDIIAQGSSPHECCFAIEGLLCRYGLTGGGGRQIVSFHVSGDMLDRDALHMSNLDHSVSSLSAARVAYVPHPDIVRLAEAMPNIGLAFWRDAVVDSGIYRQWLISIGRRNAKQRLAHLICETFTRMEAVGLAEADHFHFPVTQVQLGDALGLSAIHVNRSLQELRQDALVAWKGRVVTILNAAELREAADFDRLTCT